MGARSWGRNARPFVRTAEVGTRYRTTDAPLNRAARRWIPALVVTPAHARGSLEPPVELPLRDFKLLAEDRERTDVMGSDGVRPVRDPSRGHLCARQSVLSSADRAQHGRRVERRGPDYVEVVGRHSLTGSRPMMDFRL
jgi:hypothetical protein